MIILGINAGSSSLKFRLSNYNTKETLITGAFERVGSNESFIKFSTKELTDEKINKPAPSHKEAIEFMLKIMVDKKYNVIKSMDQIVAVGHRVVHGGDKIKKSIIITDEIIDTFNSLSGLSPLHNPANVMGITAARAVLPDVPHMAILDTAFHQTMPPHVFLYALPYEWYKKYGIRRYGFHGTSHLYIAKRAAVLLGKKADEVNIISLHIGNGASACAIKGGKSFDTSMGLTPLEGLVMGTRAGDFDSDINYFMMEKENISPSKMLEIVNKKSGVLGITEKYIDHRDIIKAMNEGDERAKLAIDMECYRIKKYIGSYMAALGRVDAIVFTAGVGEMTPIVREKCLEGLDGFGIKINHKYNNFCRTRNSEMDISAIDSKTKVFVIPTDEEEVFLEDVVGLLRGTYNGPFEYEYDFANPDYVNHQREHELEIELEEKPYLAEFRAQPRKYSV